MDGAADGPRAAGDAVTIDEDSGPTEIEVLANDDDPDGQLVEVGEVTDGEHGTTNIIGGGLTVSYQPAPGYVGEDTFTYTVEDPTGRTATATVTVTVANVNDDPAGIDDSAMVWRNSTDNAIDVLANDQDDDGDALTIAGVEAGANGTPTVSADGLSILYAPNAGFYGGDNFTYTVADGNGGSATAQVSVTVQNDNNDPVAEDDTAIVPAGSGTTVIIHSGTTVAYTPNAGFTGEDTFTYTIADGQGGTDTATVTVTVTADNIPPIANAGPDQHLPDTDASGDEEVTLDGSASEDPDGTIESYVWTDEEDTELATGGTPTITLPGGSHVITLTVTDNDGLTASDEVSITIGGWDATGSLNIARASHTATLLPDGKVLVTGGVVGHDGNEWMITDTCELYDPATRTWSATGGFEGSPHSFHNAVLLGNGKVLVVGGIASWPDATDGQAAITTDVCELYDPATGTWSITGSLAREAWLMAVTLCPDGKVLASGGTGAGGLTFELYDPGTGTWGPPGSLPEPHMSHVGVRLSDGKVLVVGGNKPATTSCALYDPGTGISSATGDLATSRFYHAGVVLNDGRVLTGGGSSSGSDIVSSCEIYDPGSGLWSYTGSLSEGVGFHVVFTKLPGCDVLATGGSVPQVAPPPGRRRNLRRGYRDVGGHRPDVKPARIADGHAAERRIRAGSRGLE